MQTSRNGGRREGKRKYLEEEQEEGERNKGNENEEKGRPSLGIGIHNHRPRPGELNSFTVLLELLAIPFPRQRRADL